MKESKKDIIGDVPADGCEGCCYFGVAVVIGCAIIGAIVWQLVIMGQILGVIIGLVTFISLLATLIAHYWVSSRRDNPRLVFRLKIAATILFFVFLIESIHAFLFFGAPIIFPIINHLFASFQWGTESGFILIGIIIFFAIIIGGFFAIPICLWAGYRRKDARIREISPKVEDSRKKAEKRKTPSRCSTCGVKLTGKEKFCKNCGIAIDSE